MNMDKQIFITDLVPGDSVSEYFLITSAIQGQARNGPYWVIDLQDSTGSIKGKIWSPHSQKYTEFPVGDIVSVSARISSYRDVAELAITDVTLLTAEEKNAADLSLFMPASPYNIAAMFAELESFCHEHFTYKPWHTFIFSLLQSSEIGGRLRTAPAAKAMHHAYAGGLLEHTLSVCKICADLVAHYACLDKQALLAGAFCHDLGKIWELTPGPVIDYTDEGTLLGHITILLDRIRPHLATSGLEAQLVQHLQHLILSHHGTLEFGSPKLPATAEAIILHYADNIDAKMQQVATALRPVEAGEWSSRVFGLDRKLFRAVQTTALSGMTDGFPVVVLEKGTNGSGIVEQRVNDTLSGSHLPPHREILESIGQSGISSDPLEEHTTITGQDSVQPSSTKFSDEALKASTVALDEDSWSTPINTVLSESSFTEERYSPGVHATEPSLEADSYEPFDVAEYESLQTVQFDGFSGTESSMDNAAGAVIINSEHAYSADNAFSDTTVEAALEQKIVPDASFESRLCEETSEAQAKSVPSTKPLSLIEQCSLLSKE